MRVSRGSRNPHFPGGCGLPRAGVWADWAERTEIAWSLRVLWAETEVASRYAIRGGADSGFNSGVVGRHVPHLAAAHVEQHQPRLGAARNQAPPGRKPVQPQLHRVGRDKRGVERGVGLVVDEDRSTVELAD